MVELKHQMNFGDFKPCRCKSDMVKVKKCTLCNGLGFIYGGENKDISKLLKPVKLKKQNKKTNKKQRGTNVSNWQF